MLSTTTELCSCPRPYSTRGTPPRMSPLTGKRSFSLETGESMTLNVAVVGNGYWGKNLVRNFFEIGALHTVCDDNPLIEANVRAKYPLVTYRRDFADVLQDSDVRGVVIS